MTTHERVDFRAFSTASLHIPRPNQTDLAFPQRSDYLQYLIERRIIASEDALDAHPEVVLDVHRHWHIRGQHGCRFAQMLSNNPAGHRWGRVVIPGADPAKWSRGVWSDIARHVESAIANAEEQALSLLFPSLTSETALVELLVQLKERLRWQAVLIDRLTASDGASLLRIGLRVPLADDITAWPIGFGPFPHLALTRRSPLAEIAFMVKPKTYPGRPNITQDPNAAHLADMQIPVITDDVWTKVWASTQSAKAERLADPGDPAAKAKVTFVVPEELWNARSSVTLA